MLRDAGEAQREVFNGLAFLEVKRLILGVEVLHRGLPHPIVADVDGADRLPGFLGGCLCGEHQNHAFRHRVADAVQRIPVVVELHGVPEMTSLEFELHPQRPIVVVRLGELGPVVGASLTDDALDDAFLRTACVAGV